MINQKTFRIEQELAISRQKRGELIEKSIRAREIFTKFPSLYEHGDEFIRGFPASLSEELAFEYARIFGEAYIHRTACMHRADFDSSITPLIGLASTSFWTRPFLKEEDGSLNELANEGKILTRSVIIDESLLYRKPDVEVKIIREKKSEQRYGSIKSHIFYNILYRLSSK